jgi:hypothetical protein
VTVELGTVVRSLLDRWAFSELTAVVEASDRYDVATERSIGALCRFALRVLDLDAEDFDRAGGVSAELAGTVRAAWFPQDPAAVDRGSLRSLVPAYEIMLEVLAIRWQRRELLHTVAVLHIIAEYLPLLAWESTLGHAGDPAAMGATVGGPGSHWGGGDPVCGHGGAQRRAARRSLTAATGDADGWRAYLDRDHSHVAGALQVCATDCSVPCTVTGRLDTDARRSVATRVRIARRFSGSPVVRLRHAAPVGHGFGVPDRGEVLAAWQRTRRALTAGALPATERGATRAVLADDGYVLPGLPALLSAVAGRPVRPGRVLHDARAELSGLL